MHNKEKDDLLQDLKHKREILDNDIIANNINSNPTETNQNQNQIRTIDNEVQKAKELYLELKNKHDELVDKNKELIEKDSAAQSNLKEIAKEMRKTKKV